MGPPVSHVRAALTRRALALAIGFGAVATEVPLRRGTSSKILSVAKPGRVTWPSLVRWYSEHGKAAGDDPVPKAETRLFTEGKAARMRAAFAAYAESSPIRAEVPAALRRGERPPLQTGR